MSEEDNGKILENWRQRAEQAEAALAETQQKINEKLLRSELRNLCVA